VRGRNEIYVVCKNGDTKFFQLRACLRCTTRGCEDSCNKESLGEKSMYECLGELRRFD
jgi:hypothetical protein